MTNDIKSNLVPKIYLRNSKSKNLWPKFHYYENTKGDHIKKTIFLKFIKRAYYKKLYDFRL